MKLENPLEEHSEPKQIEDTEFPGVEEDSDAEYYEDDCVQRRKISKMLKVAMKKSTAQKKITDYFQVVNQHN